MSAAKDYLNREEVEVIVNDKLAACRTTLEADIHVIRGFVDEVHTAFVANDKGTPDFIGHYSDHKARMDAAKAEKEFWDTAKKAVVTNGVNTVFYVLKVVLILTVIGFFAIKSGSFPIKWP